MTKTNKKGTSLVELLAVIVIMGIIAAIAVPTVGALLKNTRRKAAGSDMLTIIQSVDSYVSGAGGDFIGLGSAYSAANKQITLTYAEDSTVIAEIFDTDTDTISKVTGSIVLTLNDSLTKVASAKFDGVTYTKDSHTYSDFTFDGTTVKCGAEDKKSSN